jgi:branched-chain amino acid transport system permease protein
MLFVGMATLLALVGIGQGWDVALLLVNMCIISAIMALGVNIQWGYAGLFSIGSMGFAALGGLAGVIISAKPVPGAWQAGGLGVIGGLLTALITIVLGIFVWRRLAHLGRRRYWVTGVIVLAGFITMRSLMDPAITAIEKIDPGCCRISWRHGSSHSAFMGCWWYLSQQQRRGLSARYHLAFAPIIWRLPPLVFPKLSSSS